MILCKIVTFVRVDPVFKVLCIEIAEKTAKIILLQFVTGDRPYLWAVKWKTISANFCSLYGKANNFWKWFYCKINQFGIENKSLRKSFFIWLLITLISRYKLIFAVFLAISIHRTLKTQMLQFYTRSWQNKFHKMIVSWWRGMVDIL